MKYLFINSVAGFGSTGRIAADKCRELMAAGHECVLAFGRPLGTVSDVPTVPIGTSFDNKRHALRNRLLDDQGFGSKAPTEKFLRWVKEYDPDVIWLHNIHGYYLHIGLLFDYLRTSGKKIIWTLHDCWSFTGHCAYFDFAGCDKWKTGCCHCPQKRSYPQSLVLDGSRRNYERKKALFTGIPNVHLVVPSQWLAGRVKESFLKDYPVEVQYNTINREIFKPTESNFREKYGLEDKKIVLGVASVWDQRKGLQDFIELSKILPQTHKIVMVGLDQSQIRELPDAILGLSRTNSAKELAEVYSAADVFVNTTYEDNFPTVNLEALACGTPVVTYETGGSPEALDPTCGVVVRQGDIQAVVNAIDKAVSFPRENSLIRAQLFCR